MQPSLSKLVRAERRKVLVLRLLWIRSLFSFSEASSLNDTLTRGALQLNNA